MPCKHVYFIGKAFAIFFSFTHKVIIKGGSDYIVFLFMISRALHWYYVEENKEETKKKTILNQT